MSRDDEPMKNGGPTGEVDLADDEVLLRELSRAVAGAAAVSERSREAARAAFSWRTIDEELMWLSHDSSTSEELLVRGVREARVIGFSGRDLTLEIELDTGVLTGQVVPARPCRVSVQTESEPPVSVETDESGIFTLAFDASGPVRFTVDVDGESQRTVWIRL